MKKFLLSTTSIAFLTFTQAQVNMPQASPTQGIWQNFGMGKIELTYSRPSLKGRTVFGENSELAPLGKIWRTGANAATRITFTDKVNFGGKDIDTGSYALYTIPGKTEWEIILNKGVTNDGTQGYKESEDITRFKVPVKERNPAAETFTMQFANLKAESCDLHLIWGNIFVTVPITTNIKGRLRAQIEKALMSGNKPYWQAANFYFELDEDYPKALENVNNALKQKGNENAYYMYLFKAKVEAATGDKTNAKSDAQKCIETATKAKNDDYVRQANKLIQSL